MTVPGVVRHGVVHSAANIDPTWIGADADAIFTAALSREVHVVNDADAAGWPRWSSAPRRASAAWSS